LCANRTNVAAYRMRQAGGAGRAGQAGRAARPGAGVAHG